MQHLVICDDTGYLKATSFEVSKTENLAANTTIILKNYIVKANGLIINSKTQIFRTVPMIVTDAIVQTAANYLRPPTPPVTDIPTIKKSPVKTLHTVCGKVTKVNEAPQIILRTLIRTSNVQIHNNAN